MKICYKLIKIMLIISVIFSIMVTIGYGYVSSGGSRGITTSNVDPYSNIVKHEKIEKNLVANQSVEYSFITPEFSIYQILANSEINDYDIPIMIEDLKNKSKYAKSALGIVYRNENVWLGSTRIKYITVRFRVNNSWIEDNHLENGRLPYLLKWNGTAWSVLKTNMTGKDDTYTYFESPRAGNSRIGIFAISAPLRKVQTTNVASKNIVPVEVPLDTEQVGQYEEVVPNIEEINVKDSKGIVGFEVIIVMIGVVLLAAYATRKKT